MLLKISYPCIGGLFVLSAQIGAVQVLIVGYYFLSEPSRCLPAKKIAAKYDTMYAMPARTLSADIMP